jgi:hypothetical protein
MRVMGRVQGRLEGIQLRRQRIAAEIRRCRYAHCAADLGLPGLEHLPGLYERIQRLLAAVPTGLPFDGRSVGHRMKSCRSPWQCGQREITPNCCIRVRLSSRCQFSAIRPASTLYRSKARKSIGWPCP